ncbi:hypothetical protein SeMB42_g07425 [Synchytrium endobioticum]|uniref:Cyclic nucleotide-binding domain-containing protein n=1 Tax=Synchytrium endobioticum TaxID=286115 RepID=A0A507C724_9FUNG|nr:hypothetical protein SeMB42_g07425 [Synchytrium endobioticum]
MGAPWHGQPRQPRATTNRIVAATERMRDNIFPDPSGLMSCKVLIASSLHPPPLSAAGSSFFESNDVPAEIQTILRKHPMFASVNDESFIHSLANACHCRFSQPGEIIIEEGTEASNMFFVIKGTVQVQSGDSEIVFAQLGKGSYFGEIAILFSVNRTATVCAKSKCVLARLSAEELHIILERYPEVAVAINNEAKKRFAELKREIEKAGRAAPSMTFDGLQEKRKREFASKSSSSKSLFPTQRSSAIDIDFFSAASVNPDPVTPTVVPPEPLSSYIGSVAPEHRTPESLWAPIAHNSLPNDVASLGDSSSQVTPELTAHATPSASEDDDEDDLYDDESDVILGLPMDENDVEPFEDLSSTSDDVKSLPPMPTGGRGHPMLAAFVGRNGAKRRASVAVWSDDKLMQLANLKFGTGSTSGDLMPTPKANKWFADSILASDHDEELEPPVPEEKEELYGVLGKAIIARVLKYLPFTMVLKLRRVSRPYAALIAHPDYHLTEHADLSTCHKQINDKNLLAIASYVGPNVINLDMKKCWEVTDKGLIKAASYMPHVQHWNLASVWEVADTGLTALARSCGSLITIDLSNCRRITNVGMLAILSACPNLANVSLSYCKGLTDEVMDHPQWKRVRKLDLERCSEIRDPGFEKWRYPFTMDQQRAPISNAPANGHDSTISTSPINARQEFVLEELCLKDCAFLTDDAIISISLTCPLLRVLSLSFCCSFTETFAVSLVAGCPALEELDLSYCGVAVTDECLEILGKGLASSLDKLNLRNCVRITDAGLASLAEHALALREINVSNCKLITRAGLARHNGLWVLIIWYSHVDS